MDGINLARDWIKSDNAVFSAKSEKAILAAHDKCLAIVSRVLSMAQSEQAAFNAVITRVGYKPLHRLPRHYEESTHD